MTGDLHVLHLEEAREVEFNWHAALGSDTCHWFFCWVPRRHSLASRIHTFSRGFAVFEEYSGWNCQPQWSDNRSAASEHHFSDWQGICVSVLRAVPAHMIDTIYYTPWHYLSPSRKIRNWLYNRSSFATFVLEETRSHMRRSSFQTRSIPRIANRISDRQYEAQGFYTQKASHQPTNVAFDILFDLQLEHSWFKLLPDLSVHLLLLKFSVFVPFCPFPLFRCLIVGPGLSSPACLCAHLLLHLFQLLLNLVLLLWLSVVPITQSPGISRFGKVTLVLFSHWTYPLVSDFCRRAGLLEDVLPNAVQRPVECMREAEILPRVPYEISVHLDWRFPWRIGEGSCWWICVFKAQDQLRSLSKAPYMYLTFLLSLLVPSWIHHFLVSIVSCAKAGCNLATKKSGLRDFWNFSLTVLVSCMESPSRPPWHWTWHDCRVDVSEPEPPKCSPKCCQRFSVFRCSISKMWLARLCQVDLVPRYIGGAPSCWCVSIAAFLY